MLRAHLPRRAVGLVAGVSLVLAMAACTADSPDSSDQAAGSDGGGGNGQEAPSDPFDATLDLPQSGRNVPVDTEVSVSATSGTLDTVEAYRGARSPEHMLAGTVSKDGSSWTADDLLEPGAKYTVVTKGTAESGDATTVRDTFTTQPLSLDQQTYPSVAPLQGETVGVGMPVIVTFDVPVTDRAEIERHLEVSSTPQVQGTWHWLSDTEVHYRPKSYWPAGTNVDVDVNINGVNAGNGIYGQENREVSFKVGDSIISTVNVASHQMKVDINGKTARTVPITAGAPGFTTRSGIKLIVEKFESKRMDAATVGVQPGDPDYYNIPNVEYAMRVTYSGEFLHAAPWSEGSQGYANVSHGCVGMSTDDAAWLFNLSHRGDVVKVVGSDRPLEDGNGWTDWDMSWKQYQAGSALS